MIDDIDDDNDDEDKDFPVYDNTFDIMIHLWEDQPLKIKSSPNQTANYNTSVLKNTSTAVPIYVINAIAEHAREFDNKA
ncbi:hypothetical protein G9A89_009480 [Geosiphon pyriformis]|nr:hypothetical protein G9A89_009480 [Geosiphon pyriformis]